MIYAAEAAILARLAERCAPGSILLGTLAAVDLTDDSSSPVIGQIVLTNISPPITIVASNAINNSVNITGLVKKVKSIKPTGIGTNRN